jgi:arginine-tRNA-protein transferase
MLKKGCVEEIAHKINESIDSLLKVLDYQTKEFDQLAKSQFDYYLSKGWFRLSFGNHMFTDTQASFENQYFPIKWIRYKLDASFMSKSIKKDKNYKQSKIFTSILADLNYKNDQEELENLYARYRSKIDFDGYKTVYHVMHPGDAAASIFDSKIIKIYDKEKLIGVGLFDLGEISGAGILYYYDPNYARYGISKCISLLFLEYMVENQYRYFYPGFVFLGHPKMNYKLSLEKSGIEYYDPLKDQWLLYEA